MARYIDADKLKKLRDDVISGKLDVKTESDLIDRCPTADVVEVVRCENCINMISMGWCSIHDTPMNRYDFCSYGEKERLAEE